MSPSPSIQTQNLRNWSSTYQWIPIVGGFISFAFASMAGANDVPIFFGSSVGSGALTLPQSVALASLMEFIGATLMGDRTVDVFQSTNLKDRPDAGLLMWGFVIAMIAATIWLAIATYFEIPVSSSVSIQGALIGISVTTGGLDSINWSKNSESDTPVHMEGVLAILLSWIIAPSIAAVAGFLFFRFMKQALLRSDQAVQRTLRALPFYYGVTTLVLIFFIIYRGSPRTSLHTLPLKESTIIATTSTILTIVLVFLVVLHLMHKELGSPNANHPQSPDPEKTSATIDRKEESDSYQQQEITAEDVLRQFKELRVLDTVYEETEEETGDQSPEVIAKCNAVCGPNRITLKQLLAHTSTKFSFRRLQQSHKVKAQHPFWWRLLLKARASTFSNKIKYNRGTLVRHALAEKFNEKSEKLFDFLQIVTGCVAAFAHGSNDVPSAMNPYAATIEIYRHYHELSHQNTGSKWKMDIWILALGGIGVGLGFTVWGWKLVRSLGGRITFLSSSRGFSAQICAVSTVLLASRIGLPLSTTHIFVGAILGVAAADSIKIINWRLVISFVVFWIVTILFTCGVAFVLYSFTIFSPSVVVQ